MRPPRAGTRVLFEPATLLLSAPVVTALAVPLLRREHPALGVLPLLIALAVVAVTDFRARLIPDVVTLPALAWALGLAIIEGRLLAALTGVCVVGGLLWTLAVISRGGIGGGDVKLGAVLGAALGWEPAMLVLALSQLVGGAGVVILLALRLGTRTMPLPIGTIIAVLGATAMLAGV